MIMSLIIDNFFPVISIHTFNCCGCGGAVFYIEPPRFFFSELPGCVLCEQRDKMNIVNFPKVHFQFFDSSLYFPKVFDYSL